MSGAVIDFSAEDLAATAAAYDPEKHEAPIVVGHPKLDAPAYGWVKSLSFAGALEAEPHQVEPAFAEIVAAGRFKKISASFFRPDAPGNPVPGVYYLRHVGFLGATPPAVKGLRNPEFAADEAGIVEFADSAVRQNASLWRRLRDFLISQFGLEKVDAVIPDYTIGSLEEAAREDTPASTSGFSEPSTKEEAAVTPEQKAALEAENAQLKQELAERAAREKAAAAAARHAEHVAFAEALVTAGTLLPAQREVCVAMLDFVAGQDAVVEFGEGDARQPLVEGIRKFLQALPKQVEFGEVSAVEDAAAALAFAAPAGYTVAPEALDLHRRAAALAAANKMSYEAALAAVRAR